MEDINVPVTTQGRRTVLYPGIYSQYERKFRTEEKDGDRQFDMLVTLFRKAPNLNLLLTEVLERIEPQLNKYRAEMKENLRNAYLSPPDDDVLDDRTKKLLLEIDAISELDDWGQTRRSMVTYYINELLQVQKTDAVADYISYCLLHLDQTAFFAQ